MGMLAASFSTRQASKLLQHLQQIIYNKNPCQIGPILQSVCVFLLVFSYRMIFLIGKMQEFIRLRIWQSYQMPNF
jgi:hypothetical protein